MARPEPWRLDAASYPVSTVIPTRFQDLDSLGHINNVAMSAIFETARVHFHKSLGWKPAKIDWRWLVASITINYVAEAHFPEPVTVHHAVGSIGNTSWTLLQAAFQGETCVATCDTVVVMQGPEGNRPLDPELREAMLGKQPLRA